MAMDRPDHSPCLFRPLLPLVLVVLFGLEMWVSSHAEARLIGYVDKFGKAHIVDDSTRQPWPALDPPARFTFPVRNLSVTVAFCDSILANGHGFDDPTSGSLRRTT